MNESKGDLVGEANTGEFFRSPLVKYPGIVLIAFLAGVLFAGVPELRGTEAASWIQAVGSIIAIVAAIWIANRQHNQNVALVKAEQKRIEKQRFDEKREERALLEAELESVLASLKTLSSATRVGTANTKVLEKVAQDAAQARGQLNLIVDALNKHVGYAVGGRKLLTALSSVAGSGSWNVTPSADEAARRAESSSNEIYAALDNFGPPAQK